MPAENPDAAAAAADYEAQLRRFFEIKSGEFPRFDLILLGMGPDGHTASLFPDSAALDEQSRLVVANWVAKFNTHRITFTFPVLNRAAEVMFMVSGADKADMLHQVLEGKNTPPLALAESAAIRRKIAVDARRSCCRETGSVRSDRPLDAALSSLSS